MGRFSDGLVKVLNSLVKVQRRFSEGLFKV